ncbi:MAG TPA: DUF3224 domain-containing protein [Candidatus Binatia bacterium]|nr:DUF3224 domain-containing protein [Candidatus Binatia bacterium]
MATARGSFDITRFDSQEPHDDRDGLRLARAHISKTFHGDLTGTSETDIITVYTDIPAAYAGIERFDGEVERRRGSFVLLHGAGSSQGQPWMSWKIVETTGTGELAGIRGEGQIVIDSAGGHSYTIDYELPPDGG